MPSVIKLSCFSEVLWAATQTHRVRSRFASRGGLFLVSPPGHMKTSLLSIFEDQPGVIAYSDMTTINIVEARDSIASRKTHTLLLYDLQKLYERRADTAANIIGNLRSIMDEGFTNASWEKTSHNMIQTRARALVMAALTPNLYRQRLPEWEQSGFARRVVFVVYSLRNPGRIDAAIMRDEPIDLIVPSAVIPVNLEIDSKSVTGDDEFLQQCVGKQDGDVPLILMKKILSVLRWKYVKHLKSRDRSRDVLLEFSKCLRGSGAEIEL